MIDEMEDLFKGSFLEGHLEEQVEGILYLRYDIDDCGPKEQWDEYIEVSDELARLGLMLDDPYLEHDCISGNVIYLEE